MNSKKSVAVTIAGLRLSLKSDADAAYVQLLADYVDEKIKELGPRSSQVAPHEAAVLAALRIADDLFRERRARSELRRRVRAEVQHMVSVLPPGSTDVAEIAGAFPLAGGPQIMSEVAGVVHVSELSQMVEVNESKA